MKDRFWPEPGIFDRLGQSGAAKERMMVAARHLMADQSGHVLVGHFPSIEPLGHLISDHRRGVVEIASLAGTAGLTVILAVSADSPVVQTQTSSPENPQTNTLQIDDVGVPTDIFGVVIPQPDGSELRIVDQRSTLNGSKLPESEVKTAVPSVNNGQKPEEKPNTEGPNEPTDVVSGGGPVDQEPTVVREYSQKNPDGSVVLVKEWTDGKFTTEILEAAPAPQKIVKEVARTFPEERPDGSTWLVVQYSDGSFGQDMISGPTKQAQPPAQPPVPPSPPSSSTSVIQVDTDNCSVSNPNRKTFPSYSIAGGEGTSSNIGILGGNREKQNNYRGFVESFEKLPKGFRLVISIKGQRYAFFIMDAEAKNDKELWDKSPHNSGLYRVTDIRVHDTQTRLPSLVPLADCSIEQGDAVTVQVWDRYERNRFYNMPNAHGVLLVR